LKQGLLSDVAGKPEGGFVGALSAAFNGYAEYVAGLYTELTDGPLYM
jgi:hypothetical protein